MNARIDGITLTLRVYDEAAGHRDVTFEVPLPDEAFEEIVRAKWHEQTERLIAAVRGDQSII